MNWNGDIKAVTFDVGGTLIEPWPSVGDVYADVARAHGVTGIDATTLNRRFIEAWRGARGFDHTRASWSAVVDATFEGLTDRRPADTFFPALYEEFGKASRWRVFDDVFPVLEELASRGVPMVLVSNWDERLRPLLAALKLDGYFEGVMISSELYFAKPSNVIFEHAVRRLGVPAANVLHVGDNVGEDVKGAGEAGLQALLIDRMGGGGEGRIGSLAELLELVPEFGGQVRGAR